MTVVIDTVVVTFVKVVSRTIAIDIVVVTCLIKWSTTATHVILNDSWNVDGIVFKFYVNTWFKLLVIRKHRMLLAKQVYIEYPGSMKYRC